jgi:hypothetical protein
MRIPVYELTSVARWRLGWARYIASMREERNA